MAVVDASAQTPEPSTSAPLRRVTLSLRGGPAAVEGCNEPDDGPPRRFSGWLELAAALEALLDPPATKD
jgi:hypothetical protein